MSRPDPPCRKNTLGSGAPASVFWAALSAAGLPREKGGSVVSDRGKDRRHRRSPTRSRSDAQDALHASEERYGSVVAALAEGIVFMRADGRLEASNASAERILGLTAEQLGGRTTFDPRWRAIHEDGSPFPGDTHPITVSLRTGRPCSHVIMGVHKPSGELTWISINSQPPFRPDAPTPYAAGGSFFHVPE